jgi:hypothetical protein
MKKLILITAIVLSACATPVAVKQKFPEMPAELLKSCKELETIKTQTVSLSEFMKIVAKNYSYNHECAAQVEAIKVWYKDQKKIFDEANK